MRTSAIFAAALLTLTSSTPGLGQPAPVQGAVPSGTASGPADAALMSSMDAMFKAMTSAPMTGNPDRDFVAMMIPHHQGAIDMARFELAHGTDPAMRKLATSIVAAQEKEVAEMQAWQQAHSVNDATSQR